MSDKKRYSDVVCRGGYRMEKTKNGHLQMIIPLKVVKCEDSSRVGEEFTAFKVIVLSNDKSVKYGIETLRALGMTNNDILNPEGLGNTIARCCEENELYDGKWRWKTSWIAVPKERGSISAEDLGEFAAVLSAALRDTPPVPVTDANRAPEKLPDAPVNTEAGDPGIQDEDW